MVTSELPSAQAFRVFPPSRPVPISGNFSKSQTKRSLFVTRAEKWKFILPYQSSVQSDPCFEPFQNPLDCFSPLERGNTKGKPIRCTLVFLRKDWKAVSYSNSTLSSSFLRSRLHFLILIVQHSGCIMWTPWCFFREQRTAGESALPFHHVDPREGTQAIKLESQGLNLLSQLAGPFYIIMSLMLLFLAPVNWRMPMTLD